MHQAARASARPWSGLVMEAEGRLGVLARHFPGQGAAPSAGAVVLGASVVDVQARARRSEQLSLQHRPAARLTSVGTAGFPDGRCRRAARGVCSGLRAAELRWRCPQHRAESAPDVQVCGLKHYSTILASLSKPARCHRDLYNCVDCSWLFCECQCVHRHNVSELPVIGYIAAM